MCRRLSELFKKQKKKLENKELDLYFYRHPITWWDRFNDVASDIKILPWRSLNSDMQKCIIPNNSSGKKMLEILFNLEERFPNFFVKYFCNSMIIITKKLRLPARQAIFQHTTKQHLKII